MSCFSRFFSPEQKHTSKGALNFVVWLLEIRCHVPFSKEILTPVLAEEQERTSEDAAQFEDHYLQMK